MKVGLTLENKQNNRILYLDVLRLLAIFVMIMLHVASTEWYFLDVNTWEWQIHNIYHSISNWSVSVFVMVSGVNLLDPDRHYSIRNLLFKKVFRMTALFVLWSGLYAVTRGVYAFAKDFRQFGAIQPDTVERITGYFLEGHYHLWFLPMITALYLLTPLLRSLCQNENLMRYFLVIALLFETVFPALEHFPALKTIGSMTWVRIGSTFSFTYASYFVLGRYLHTHRFSTLPRCGIYAAGLLSLFWSVVSSAYASAEAQTPTAPYTNFSWNVLLLSIMTFVFCQELSRKIPVSEKRMHAIAKVSKMTFGVYLFHDMVLIVFRTLGISTLSFSPVLTIPLYTVLVYGISLLVVYFVGKIKYFRKIFI